MHSLEELLEKHHINAAPKTIKPEEGQAQDATEPVSIPEETSKAKHPPRPRIESCPPTELKELVINGKTVALQTNAVSLSRTVKPAKLSLYLKQSERMSGSATYAVTCHTCGVTSAT